MKRFISIAVIIMVLSALAFTACGGGSSSDSQDLSDSKYVGTWKTVELTFASESGELEEEFLLVLNGDGTGTLEAEGEDPSEFIWEPTSNGFKTKGSTKLTFTDDGDKIKAKILGAELYFEKQ